MLHSFNSPPPLFKIWATQHIPEEPFKEMLSMARYREQYCSCILCDYTAQEIAKRDRIVCENTSFICLVPFWAVWPYETMVLPKRHILRLVDLDESEKADLADILR